MPADYSRIHRLLKICTLIQGGSGWTARRLALECAATERTIYRDLRILESAGIPYFFDDEKKCYSIRRDFYMPPVQLTLDETLALAALAEHVGGREQVPFLKPAVRAIAKVRGQLPPGLRQALERIESHVAIQLAAANPPEAAEDVYARVQRALQSRRALRCRYESAGRAGNADARARNDFIFLPYALFFGTRAWYVVGHHAGHKEVRCLKLGRFTAVHETNQAYDIPASFTLERHLGRAWRMIRGKPRCKVELIFDAEFADTVSDTQWHPTQQIEWLDDGSIRFRCSVDGLDEIVWWVLGMGPHCVVRQPAALAERVRQLAIALQHRYDPVTVPVDGKANRDGEAKRAGRASADGGGGRDGCVGDTPANRAPARARVARSK
jgi:proteasome accessory factor B